MISCLMATRNRPSFLRMAMAHFLYQTEADLELIIVDDSDEPIDRPVRCPPIHYIHLPKKTSTGEKLNIAADLSSGEVLAKLDDDDYYNPMYLAVLNHEVQKHPTKISAWCCALVSLLHHNPNQLYFSGHGWRFGSTFSLHRSLWQSHPFPRVDSNPEGKLLVSHAFEVNHICHLEDFHVIMRHGSNTWNRTIGINVDDFFRKGCKKYGLSLTDIVGPLNMEFYLSYARHKI